MNDSKPLWRQLVLAAAFALPSLLQAAPEYIGRTACTGCHESQASAWKGSHHDLAMQKVSEGCVLGDFNQAKFEHFGLTSEFFQRDGKYLVRTDGPDDQLQDFEIKYCFGVDPLQQYLIEFPGGRLQALDIAWDSRPKAQGGQRWFHLHPDEKITKDSVLHWTGAGLNWNTMCADCHSTNLRKGYDEASNSYSTTWSELNVSCEACHGPGSDHRHWAQDLAAGKDNPSKDKGLTLMLDERKGIHWNTQDNKVVRSAPLAQRKETQLCAQCHSRRSQLADGFIPGHSLLDNYLPSLLDDGLYFADGQIQDEVYEWGSFMQSRMAKAGVTCSDCHDPHSGKTRAPGAEVCSTCHLKERYQSPQHHHHPTHGQQPDCLGCHMPTRAYMGVHQRHDHSMRVPRPDLSASLGTPNACNQCHADKDVAWAANQVRTWYGRDAQGLQRYAPVLSAARSGALNRSQQITQLAQDATQPAIASASALALLPAQSQQELALLQAKLSSDDELEILGALRALENAPTSMKALALPLAWDERKTIRILAARLAASYPRSRLKPEQAQVLTAAIKEWEDTQRFNADRPDAQMNLAGYYTEIGQHDQAEAAYRKAIQLQPRFAPAYVNFAHALSQRGRETEADGQLRAGLRLIPKPENAVLHHALGLSLVRQKKAEQALPELEQAARLNSANQRYTYVYAVALQSAGQLATAIEVLERSVKAHPDDVESLFTLAGYLLEAGEKAKAKPLVEKLHSLFPNEPAVQQLAEQL